jgi:ankyrin repeat protein
LRDRKESIRMSTSSGIGSLSTVVCHLSEALSHGSTVRTRLSLVITILLRRDLIVCCTLQNGTTPIYLASQKGHTDVLQLLIDARADVNQPNKVTFLLSPTLYPVLLHHTV